MKHSDLTTKKQKELETLKETQIKELAPLKIAIEEKV